MHRTHLKIVAAAAVMMTSFAFAQDLSVPPGEALTLKEACALALKQSETIAIDEETIKEAEGKFYQALSTALPQLSWGATSKWQDKSSDNSARHYTPGSAFNLTQPLFSGFKEFAAIGASRALHKQHQAELERARQLLFVDVSDAFYLLKNYQEELAVLIVISEALTQRLAEVKRRQALGRSRDSETVNIESRYFQNQAKIENVKAQEAAALSLLSFLVGKEIQGISKEDVVLGALKDVAWYLKKAEARADVKAALNASMVSQKNEVAARSGYWPTVNVVGNSYTKRVGSMADSDWDVTLNVSVPVFNSGETKGKVIEARAQAKMDQLKSAQALRRARLDITNTYIALNFGQQRTEAFAKAVESAQKNYDLHVKDYANSLVSNLEVLQALEDLQAVRLEFIAVKNETQRSYWSFKAAIGELDNDAF